MLKNQLNNALRILKAGETILYPTDTLWGIGCDATNPQAVKKIIDLKQIPTTKNFIILLDSDNKLQSYVNHVPDVAYALIEYAENPLTIVYSGAKNLAPNVIAPDGSVGIRIINHPFCSQLIKLFRKPIVLTSANFSGAVVPLCFTDINPKLIKEINYIVDFEQDIIKPETQSTLMKLEENGTFKFIAR